MTNIIIKNNSIDQGKYSDGTNPFTYNYAHSVFVFGSAIIEGNDFLNPAANANMLRLGSDAGCLIKNNRFVRNNTTINSYILQDSPANQTHSITDNIFDSTTTNGTNEVLVYGLAVGSLYTRNKNQTGFIYIPIYDNDHGKDIFGTTAAQESFLTISNAGTAGLFAESRNTENLITAFNASTSLNNLGVTRSLQISSYMESGMNITQVTVGCFVVAGTMSSYSGGSKFFVKLQSFLGTRNMNAKNYATGLLDDYKYAEFLVNSAGALTNLKTDTQFITTNNFSSGGLGGNYSGFTLPDVFTVGNGYHIELLFGASVAFDSTLDFNVKFSPLQIKYTW